MEITKIMFDFKIFFNFPKSVNYWVTVPNWEILNLIIIKIFVSTTELHISICRSVAVFVCLVELRMNYSESDFNDLVVMIKKSETADLMDYTNSGQGSSIFFFSSFMNNLQMMTTFRQFKR